MKNSNDTIAESRPWASGLWRVPQPFAPVSGGMSEISFLPRGNEFRLSNFRYQLWQFP